MSFSRSRGFLIASLLVIASLGSLLFVFNDFEAVGTPAITIQLAQSKQTAYIDSGNGDVATFTGTVFVQIPYSPNIQYVVVELNSTCGGLVTSDPPAMTFSRAQNQQSFTISVQVPVGTSSKDDYQFIVGGIWYYSPGLGGGNIDETTAILLVKQYFDADLYTETPFTESLRPDELEIPFIVENTGNGEDHLRIEITNSPDLLENEIEVLVPDDDLYIDMGASEEVSIIAIIDDNTRLGTYEIELVAESINAEDQGIPSLVADLTIYLKVVKELSDPEPEDPEEPEEPQEPEEPEDPQDPEPEPEDPEEPQEPEEPEGPADDDDGIDDAEDSTDISTGSSFDPKIVIVPIVVILVIALAVGIYFIVRSRSKK